MKNNLFDIWAKNEASINAWLSIPNSFTAEAFGKMGWDSVTIDMQHGQNDYSFASRFQSMTDYGKAQDKLNSENVWADHTDFTDDVTWKGFNLVRVIETNWD